MNAPSARPDASNPPADDAHADVTASDGADAAFGRAADAAKEPAKPKDASPTPSSAGSTTYRRRPASSWSAPTP